MSNRGQRLYPVIKPRSRRKRPAAPPPDAEIERAAAWIMTTPDEAIMPALRTRFGLTPAQADEAIALAACPAAPADQTTGRWRLQR